MDIRRIVLRISLGFLGLTALSAVLLVLSPGGRFSEMLIFSGLVVTVAGGLAIPMATWTGRPDRRWGGVAGLAFLSTQIVLCMLAIWAPVLPLAPPPETAGWLSLVLLFCAPSLVLGGIGISGLQRAAGWTAIGSAIGLLLVGLVDAVGWGGPFVWPYQRGAEQLRFISFGLLFAGGAAAFSLLVRPPAPRSASIGQAEPSSAFGRNWPRFGLYLAVVGFVLLAVLVSMFGNDDQWGPGVEEFAISIPSSVLGFAYAFGIANALFLPRLDGVGSLVRGATVAAGFLAALLLTFAFQTDGMEPFPAALGATFIVLVCGSIAVILLARFRNEPVMVTDATVLQSIDLVCPRCKHAATVPLGKSACRGCGLRFAIEVEEPRCSGCGQLLVGVRGDQCPECGQTIAHLVPAPPITSSGGGSSQGP